MASYPSYNPNHPQLKIQKNRALVDAYELGSVLKPIVLSKALEENIVNKGLIEASKNYSKDLIFYFKG